MTIDPTNRSAPTQTPAAADTRVTAGLEGRLYAVPFARVWDQLLRGVDGRSRWDLVHRDEEMGLVTVNCRGLLPGRAEDLSVWVTLDDNGLTRVDARCGSRGRRDGRAGERRIRQILCDLDRALGTEARIRG